MKIVQVLPELNEGGVERGVVELNREFSKRGHECYVISCGGKLEKKITSDGGVHIKHDVCSKNIFNLVWRVWQFQKIIKKINPDIVHARSRVPAWIVYFSKKFTNFNFVTTIHGMNSVNQYSKIMIKGDRVIAVGEVVKNHVVNGYGFPSDKIKVIQRGVDMNAFNENKLNIDFVESFRQKYNLYDKYVVTTVGRVTWLKDYETFIKAISLLKKDIKNICGLIVGGVHESKKKYFDELVKIVKEYDVENEILFVGSQANIKEIYFLSDVVVNASLKMGNIGRTIVESLAMNTPVIATTYEGLKNIVIDDVNGYLIETKNEIQLAEKIKMIKQDRIKSVRMTIPEEYTLDYMVEDTLIVYRSLL